MVGHDNIPRALSVILSDPESVRASCKTPAIRMRALWRAAAVAVLLVLAPIPSSGQARLEMCSGRPNTPDKTCLVDGDTLWLNGENIRLKDFDTPEPQTAICGGAAEVELAHRASARLLDLLNTSPWTIERYGYDGTSSRRRLATIFIGGRDVGDILIDERLARRWPNGEEWWCQ